MKFYTRKASVDGVQMSVSPVKVEDGEIYQTVKGSWKVAEKCLGSYEIDGEKVFGYAVREATEAEIAQATAPVSRSTIEDFWSDFSDATDYVR